MATVVTRYVDKDSTGGNGTTKDLTGTNAAYASLSAWNTARARNLVSADEIEKVILCSNHANHTADTTPVTLSGWTTDSTRYIQIEAEVNHGGKWNTSVYRMEHTATAASQYVLSTNGYVGTKVYGLQVSLIAGSYDSCIGIDNSGAGAEVAYCIVKSDGNNSGMSIWGINIGITPDGVGYGYAWNNLVYDMKGGSSSFGIRAVNNYGNHTRVYNNTIINCYFGIGGSNGNDTLAINNLIYGCENAPFWASGNYASGTGWNATDASDMNYTVDSPGAQNDRVSQTFSFTDSANKDFSLTGSDTGALNYGKSDPGSGLFSDDIKKVTRPGTWDIGALEYPTVLEQEGYRFRNDDGSETTATWKANQDTSVTAAARTPFRLRFLVNTTGDVGSKSYQLEWKTSGGSYWRKVIP